MTIKGFHFMFDSEPKSHSNNRTWELGRMKNTNPPPPKTLQVSVGDLNIINSALARGKTEWEISFH